MMDLAMNFDTDECLVTAMFDKGSRNDTMEEEHIKMCIRDRRLSMNTTRRQRKQICLQRYGPGR